LLLAGGHLPLAGVSLGIRLLQKHGWVNFKVFFGALMIPGNSSHAGAALVARRAPMYGWETGNKKDPPACELVTKAGGSFRFVRKGGLEPPRPKAQEPKSCVSANFTTRAWLPAPDAQAPEPGPETYDGGCQSLL
jgi:hypothetical protein